MKRCKFLALSGIVALALILTPILGLSAPVTFFGEDLGLGEATRLLAHPNADAAQTAFLANLVGVGTENFESFSNGTGAPLPIVFPGAGTATINGTGSIVTQATGTNGYGRYPISGDNFWESGSNFSISFSDPIAAFGFYGVDIGDFDGQVVLTMATGGPNVVVNIGNSINIAGGSVLYFGFYDLVNQYTSISFGNTAAGIDYFAFDDMTIGSLEQVDPIPEPTSILLLGSGVLALAVVSMRKRIRK